MDYNHDLLSIFTKNIKECLHSLSFTLEYKYFFILYYLHMFIKPKDQTNYFSIITNTETWLSNILLDIILKLISKKVKRKGD